ncbi:MAG: NAD-dependent epimerase/dehydratase family protein [Candidatus Omnitrophica bacterium]|nr:NAD-dependent epimerase/dehydratase family protein [Candidatus Omnitrophota bacterium]
MFYKGKVALVTGGTGFVGFHIAQALLKRGAKVRVTMHKRPIALPNPNLELVVADLSQQADCLHAMEGVQYVFHAAGAVASAAVKNPMSAITQNLVLTSQVLQAAWSAQVERLLLFGSSTAYPALEHPVKEDEMWSGDPHPSYFGYGWMRRYLEKMGEFVHKHSNTKIAIVRPTAIYGTHDNFDLATCHVIPALIRKAVERFDPLEVWGTGNEERDILHVSDLAYGCLLMLEKYATADPINIGKGESVTIKELVKSILRAAGYEKANVIFDANKPRTIDKRIVDIAKAREILGFSPAISLDEGLRNTVEWYKVYSAKDTR